MGFQLTFLRFFQCCVWADGPSGLHRTVKQLTYQHLGEDLHRGWNDMNIHIYIYVYIYMCVCICIHTWMMWKGKSPCMFHHVSNSFSYDSIMFVWIHCRTCSHCLWGSWCDPSMLAPNWPCLWAACKNIGLSSLSGVIIVVPGLMGTKCEYETVQGF